jgi:hypothetical protein
VIKAIAGYQKACTRSTIVNAFRRAGIATRWSGEHSALIARVERSGADKITHWTFEKRRIPLRASLNVPTSAVPPEEKTRYRQSLDERELKSKLMPWEIPDVGE